MTPQERKLIDELFERLASLENIQRDPDAVAAINDGLRNAPNALYPLVQTALVQDEALKRADARIRELEAELGVGEPQQPPQGGFLDNMRDALIGKREQPRGSVPPVRPGASSGAAPGEPGSPWRNTTGRQEGYAPEPGYPGGPQPGYGAGQPPGYASQPGYGGGVPGSTGGSFLGTAAATAAGVVGGALLMNSFRGMFGGHGQSQSAFDSSGGGSPWGGGGGNLSNTDLARDAGVNDIGRGGGGRNAAYDDQNQDRQGLFDTAQNDSDNDDGDDDDGGYDDGGDTDTA
jgi:hypothetical protein